MTKILLIDDERSFIDNRECVTAKSSEEAIGHLSTGESWDEIWFDFSLVRSDTIMDVLFYLEDGVKTGYKIKIGLCRIHTSSSSGQRLIDTILTENGYVTQFEDHAQELHVK